MHSASLRLPVRTAAMGLVLSTMLAVAPRNLAADAPDPRTPAVTGPTPWLVLPGTESLEVFRPQSSIFRPHSSVLNPPSSTPKILYTVPMPQYFTLQQANQTLDVIRPLLEQVQRIRRRVLDTQPEAWTAIEKSMGNGGNRTLSRMVPDFERLDALVHQILAAGVLIKDINIGLLDFPALKDGREVYLCWREGEGGIAYWHEVDAGYAGRRPIESFLKDNPGQSVILKERRLRLKDLS